MVTRILRGSVVVLLTSVFVLTSVFAQTPPTVTTITEDAGEATVTPVPTMVMPPNEPMVGGVTYDPAACGPGSGLSGGLFVCMLQPAPVPTDTPVPAPPTDTPMPATATAIAATATSVAATATAVATLTPVPPAPTPTNTLLPFVTATPVASATPISGVTSIAGVPICGTTAGPQHDPVKWHPLVERNADGSILCTYGHEHGSNPHVFDTDFGQLLQEISFPWTTSIHENDTDPASLSHPPSDNRPVLNGKHAFFKWETLTPAKLATKGLTCPAGTGKSFDKIRMQVHADANAGADVRFHSFYVQAEECAQSDPNYHGFISMGGHFDYGILNAMHQGSVDVRVPVPGTDPCVQGAALSNGTKCPYASSRRIHGASSTGPAGSTDPNAQLSGAQRNDFTWYGAIGNPDLNGTPGLRLQISDGIRETDWGPVDPNNPHGPVLFYPPSSTLAHNHGIGGIDILDFVSPQASAFANYGGATVHSDGTYSYSGWSDFRGFVQKPGVCIDGPGVACIPFTLSHVKPGEAQFSNDAVHVAQEVTDVKAPNGASLIAYPN